MKKKRKTFLYHCALSRSPPPKKHTFYAIYGVKDAFSSFFNIFWSYLQGKKHILHYWWTRLQAIYGVNGTFSIIFGERFKAIYDVNSTFSIIFGEHFETIYGVNGIFSILFGEPFEAIYGVNGAFSNPFWWTFGSYLRCKRHILKSFLVNVFRSYLRCQQHIFNRYLRKVLHLIRHISASNWPFWASGWPLLASKWQFLISKWHFKKARLCYKFCLLGGSCGAPPWFGNFPWKTALGPHKEFGPKFGAVILENLGPKSCIFQFWQFWVAWATNCSFLGGSCGAPLGWATFLEKRY